MRLRGEVRADGLAQRPAQGGEVAPVHDLRRASAVVEHEKRPPVAAPEPPHGRHVRAHLITLRREVWAGVRGSQPEDGRYPGEVRGHAGGRRGTPGDNGLARSGVMDGTQESTAALAVLTLIRPMAYGPFLMVTSA